MEAGPSARLHFQYKFMFASGLGSWDVGLVTLALDLSFRSWAFSPASFLQRNYASGLEGWSTGFVTSALDLSFWKLGRRNSACFWTWKLGRWTCHSSDGLVFWKLGLRPSFILNTKLCLLLDSKAGTLDLSLRQWTCLFEAGPSAQLDS